MKKSASALKQLPVLDTATIAFAVAAPFDFVVGRRQRTVPSGITLELLELQQRIQKVSSVDTEQLSPEQQGALVEQYVPLLHGMYDVMARLLNTVIVAWNLHEYARPDGQAYGRASQITRDDVVQMPDELRTALLAAAQAKTISAEAERDAKK